MKKNPFSVLDFMGYVFPGAFGVLVIYILLSHPEINSLETLLGACVQVYNEIKPHFSLEETLFFTLVSYILGHFIAYLSSLTVEMFSVWLYGYPSDYLLGISNTKYFVWSCSSTKKKVLVITNIWRSVVACILMPISICAILFGEFLEVKALYIKKLDSGLRDAIKNHSLDLLEYLDFKEDDTTTDFHRVIHHYEYEKQTNHAVAMDNYVALYDFLRSITFIFNSVFLFWFISGLESVLQFWDGGVIDWNRIVLLVTVMIITYIFFMGFMKFYRRYTLENFMCLIIDKSYVKK